MDHMFGWKSVANGRRTARGPGGEGGEPVGRFHRGERCPARICGPPRVEGVERRRVVGRSAFGRLPFVEIVDVRLGDLCVDSLEHAELPSGRQRRVTTGRGRPGGARGPQGALPLRAAVARTRASPTVRKMRVMRGRSGCRAPAARFGRVWEAAPKRSPRVSRLARFEQLAFSGYRPSDRPCEPLLCKMLASGCRPRLPGWRSAARRSIR